MNLQATQQKPTNKFLNFIRNIATFSRNKIEQAKAKLYLGEHKSRSKKIHNKETSARGMFYKRPLVMYKHFDREGYYARVSRSLALVLESNGQAIIIKGN